MARGGSASDAGAQMGAGTRRGGPVGPGQRRPTSRPGPVGGPPESADAVVDSRAVGGPGTAGSYPDLNLERPAPRVDVTRREESEPTRVDDGPPEPDRAREVADEAERAIQEAFFGQGGGLSTHDTAVDRVVDKLFQEVERRMQIERERRGL